MRTDSNEEEFYEAFAGLVADTAKIGPLIDVPYGVEVTTREVANSTYYFLLNLTPDRHSRIQLPEPKDDVIAERAAISEVSLEPLGVAVQESRG